MHSKSLGVHLLLLLFTASFTDFVKSTFACNVSSDHYSELVKALNVTVRSEGALDTNKTPSTSGLAYIEVNGKNYATQTKGFNVAAFDALSGRFLTSAAYDCAANQSECDGLGTFITSLPQDTLVFLAVQESASSSGKTLPSSVDQGLGAKNFGSVGENTAYALIGYKGNKSVDWENDEFKGASSGPAEVSAVIPIDCSYVPQVSTTCSLFNVASQKYGGSCTSQSSSLSSATNCQYAVDGNFSSGWESSSSGAVNSYIQIGFHTIFTINKLRIQQNAAKGQLIQELFIQFSDCSNEKITLPANNTELQDFTFLSRRANWVKLTVQKVYGSSGGVGIQEIEFYNELCTQKTICDAVHLGNGTVSSRYRLLRTKFPFMVDAEEQVSVLLTSESRSASSRYEVVIASKKNTFSILKRIKDDQSKEVIKVNTSSLVKENEMRSFWIEVEKGRIVFGSGEKVQLFWRDAEPIKVKYAFLSTTDSAATFHICGRVGQCYKDAAHFWPLDKSTVFVRDINKAQISKGKIHGAWTLRTAAAKLGFTPLALGLTGSSSWIDLGDFRDSCATSLSRCPGGFSASFKANVAQSGAGTGYFLSAATFNVYYVNETVHFVLQDKERVWEVKGSYVKTTWQTFAMSWSRANGLTTGIIGDASSSVLRDPVGRTVTPSAVTHTSMTIGRPYNKKSNYVDAAIRDVALWEEEISEDRIAKLHVCDDPDTCAAGWEYFDGSCYKVTFKNLSSSAAREACLSESADLVKITSEEENSFVNSIAQGEAWIGLEKEQDGVFYWKDGVRNSFNGKWKTGSPGSDPCVVMESGGAWRNILCSLTAPKYVCEQVRHHYLGCYEDSTSSPAFVFNPGGYKPNSMTPGLCMHACGYWYFTFAALKRGDLCLCSNSTSPANERASDMCSAPCLGSGDQKCGGDVHYISVYKSVEVRPLQLTMSSDPSVVTLSTFNITLTPTFPNDHAVEYYTINVGDGSIYHTTQQFSSIAILQPGTYNIQGRAIVKHSKTGYRSTIESSVTVTAVSSLTDIEVFCPFCAPINSTVSCSVKFRYGSEANVLVQFDSGEDPVNGSLPDAAVITWGIAVGEAGSPVTSDGLYLVAAMDAAGKGEVVAFEMDLAVGGGLEIQVFRPNCVDSNQRYCPAQKMCISNFTLCSQNAAKSCGSEKAFSFAGGPCPAQNMSCCQNKTLGYGNFDYKRFSGFAVYTTSGLKRILIENKTERIQVEAGDVFGVRFPVSGPAAALKTSSAGSSLFYSSSVLNKTNSSILLGNRLPLTEDSPRQTRFAPAIALIYTTDSESKLENVYEDVGQKEVIISIANSKSRLNYTKSICLQETIRGLQLDLPEALPFAETVNLTVSITQGSNVTYSWDFGDKSNATSVTPWVLHDYTSVGKKSLSVLAGNNVGLMTLWCTVVIQERISGLQFKNDSLLAIENGTTARIGWMLFNGSHVDFNITITYPDGNVEATNLTNAKAPAARFFAMYKKNLTVPGWHRVQITATNKVNNETITGNLSVQLAVNGVAMNYSEILRTNQAFNFTIFAHQGEAMARYSLKTADGKILNTTDKVIPYAYTKAGRYKATLIAANDISAVVVNCAEIVVQDMIEGLQYTSFNHTVAVHAELEIFWRLTRGSELYLIIDYGDGFSKIVNRSISVSSVFVAISKHNYTKPGDYLVIINATNLVDSQTINTTVHVETPGNGSGLAVGRGNLTKAVSGPCTGAPLYVAVNDSVTATATIVNGTNLHVALDFGDGSSNRRLYFHRQFPDEGWTSHHSYLRPGEYNITVTFFNRNPQNASYNKCRVIVQYPVTVVEVTSDSPKRSSNSTITLNVSFPVHEPSGPLNYQWLHGDNTTQILRDTRKTNHSYPNQCGVYVATVNVSNEVSYDFGMAEIIIQDAIQGLNVSKHYTEFNTNDKDNCLGFYPDHDFFPLEFKVVFNASITRGTNATFLWSFLSDGVSCSNMTCRHKFKHPGENKVRITVNNSVSNQTKEFEINLVESILNVSLTNDGPTEQKRPVNFTLAMGQTGSDSCFEVDLNDEKKLSFRSGTEPGRCHPKDQKVEKSQRFNHTYNNEGEYNVVLTAKNRVSCVAITSKVPVAVGFCIFPRITAPGFEGETKEFKRSEKITIKTFNTIDCYDFSTEFRWEIYKLCDSNEPRQITVANKPKLGAINMSRSELTLPPLFFNYCKKLEVRFMINMTKAKGVYSEKKIYLEITKSKLVAIIDGGLERTVGEEERVEIDAGRSNDPDFDTTKSTVDNNLTYAWFCMRVGDNYTLPENLTNLPPIPTPPPKTDNSSNITEAENLGGCFGWGPGQLNFTRSKKIELNTLDMTADSTYVIRFVLVKDERTTFEDQRIKVLPGDPPTLGIECVHNCASKLNPATKLTLRGKGKSKGNKKIFYKWKIKRCRSPDDIHNCEEVNEETIRDYSGTALDSDNLVIKAGFFKGGATYKIILSGQVEGGVPGSSTYVVRVNKPPEGSGNCKAKPPEGRPLEREFKVSCTGFEDEDQPLLYQFFYTADKGERNETLGSGLDPSRVDISLPNGKEEYGYNITFYVTVSDKLGASRTVYVGSVKVEKMEIKLEKLETFADGLGKIAASGNVKETANLVSTLALVLNDQKEEKKSEKTKRREVREKLVDAMLDNQDVSGQTSPDDLLQISTTVGAATAVPGENTPEMMEKVSTFIENAGKALLQQATAKDASSEKIKEASGAVFDTAVNVLLTEESSNQDDKSSGKEQSSKKASEAVTQKTLKTVDVLAEALVASKIPGEEETKLESKASLALGVSRENVDNLGDKKTISLSGSEVVIPANFSAFGSVNSSVDRMSMVSATNLYSGGQGAELVNSKLVRLSFSVANGSKSKKELTIRDLKEEEAISVIIPRRGNEKLPDDKAPCKLYSNKANLHTFNETWNESAVNIRVEWQIDVEMELYVKKGSEPKPNEGDHDFNGTLKRGEHSNANSSNISDPNASELFLSNDALNWTAEGMYFVSLRFKANGSLPAEEKAKMTSDGAVLYNFSVYSSMCRYYDERKKAWSTEGTKVGRKTSLEFTECLTTHLTTFGSNFFVPPNKINFKELSVEKLLDSPHALITVCVILGLYLICLIPARRADRSDALKTGVTPLPDNDSRDTYCYEIHVHTGFARGAGTSAEVSIVLMGGLGDSQPRVLKDPNRKNFKTGSVDPFLLTVPQSLGNLKHIRIWHNNGGNYPSWNLLRVMIQDIQTDQRWWFVCDDWLAVDESDGKIERTIYPASKKELTKFNVLFTSEVRKNLTDGHIWFSVVTRPPRSIFTRVQRLTCCLSILMTTMVANAMFYEVGKYETPKNAIRIMGFSFSIRQVSIGIMSSLVVFPANLIIVTIFRKVKPKENRYTLKNENVSTNNIDVEAGEETEGQKKPPAKFALPHWFVYVAYGIAFVATCTSATFVIFYGMEFGPEKSGQWLSSMTISFLQDVLFMQPIKVFVLATLFALLIKDPKKAEQDSFTDANALANDEEWLHKNAEDLDAETQQELKQMINDKPPDEAKLEIARKLRMKEKQMKSIIREIVWYVIFLLVLLTISYGNRDLTTSKVTGYMQNIFEKAAYSGNVTYKKVHEINHYWEWLNDTFIPSLLPQVYYDNSTSYERGYIADIPTAWLLGKARLRQLRIRKDTCIFKRLFLHFIHECNDFYSISNEDQGSYFPGWKERPLIPYGNISLNHTTTPTKRPQEPSEKGPWHYQTGDDLKTYPYWGYKATYSAGGYVQVLPKRENDSKEVVETLNANNWLDRYTRAIFSEFAIYNANVNLFSVVTLLFEQLPTGSLTPYPSILTLRLFRYVGGEMYFVLTCEIVYLSFCLFFVFREIKLFIKKGREHLKNPWSILEMVLTLLSLSAVGLYFARLTFTKRALKSMEENGTGFVSFHYTAFLDEWLKCIMGVIVFLSFLKMFRLLRFNRRMSMLQQVLKRCFGQLLSFMVMFAFAFLAFALLASLVFGQSMEGFGTFWRSCASLMDTLLGKFTLRAMVKANRIIGPIFFYSYTVSMVFILLNMFISIINDAFTEVRSDVEKQSNDYEIVDFMVHRLKENIGKTMGHAIHPIYKEPKSELEVNFDKISDNADNAMHFMRNIAFEDMRKTRWFQTDNCTEKKKNLMKLLMEVEWDFYEAELCDSIPVFERFLSQRSEEELEDILQDYRQKRMVEDIVFNQVHGEEDSTEESGSDSGNSDGSSSEDEKSSHDEIDSENEPVSEDGPGLLTPPFGNTSRPVSAVKVKSPAVLFTDVEVESAELQWYEEDTSRKGSFVEEAASEVELLKILDDVRREQESRCATDAELDSILYYDTLSDDVKPSRSNSVPETITGKKNGGKKKRKKKQEAVKVVETPKENTTKEAWMSMEDVNPGDGEPEDESEEKKKNKETKEAKREKSDLEQEKGEADEIDGKLNRKSKKKVVSGGQPEMDPTQNKNSDLETTGNGEEEASEGKEKMKAKRKKDKSGNKKVNDKTESIEDEETTKKGGRSPIVGGTSGEMAEEEIHEEVGQKKKKKKKRNNENAVSPTTVDNGEDKPNEIEETKKEAAGQDMTGEEKPVENEETPKKKKKKKQEAAREKIAGEEKTDENEEMPRTKKKKKEATAENTVGEERTDANEETPKKKKKKKEAAGANIAGQEKTDENEETTKKKKRKEKLQDEIGDILEAETLTLTDADQVTKKQEALEYDDGLGFVQSDEMAETTEKRKNEDVITVEEESQC